MTDPGVASGTQSAEIMCSVRTDLVRVAIAHGRRAEVACGALPGKGVEAPPWLYDAWRGSSMASLYAQVLASVLRDVQEELPAEKAEDVRASVEFLLENGTEDENADVWPAESEPADAPVESAPAPARKSRLQLSDLECAVADRDEARAEVLRLRESLRSFAEGLTSLGFVVGPVGSVVREQVERLVGAAREALEVRS